MAQQGQVRVVGGAYSALTWNGQKIAYLDAFTDSGQQLMGGSGGGQGYEAITPLGSYYPVEFALGTVMTEGQLTISIRELWNYWCWQALGLTGNDISQIMINQAANGTPISAVMTIRPPGSATGRTKTYHNCVIHAVDDSENVSNGAMSMPRRLTAVYTNYTVSPGVGPDLPLNPAQPTYPNVK